MESTVETYCKIHSNCGSLLSDSDVSEISCLIRVYPQELDKILFSFFEPATKTYAADSQYLALCWAVAETVLLSSHQLPCSVENGLMRFSGKGEDEPLDPVLAAVFGRTKLIVIECIVHALEKRCFVAAQLVTRIRESCCPRKACYDSALCVEQKENAPVLLYLAQKVSGALRVNEWLA